MKIYTILSIVLVSFSTVGFSQDSKSSKSAPMPIPEAKVYTTKQSVQIEGTTINLKADAGTLQIRDTEDKPIANFGFTAYTKQDARGQADGSRPIVFAFNGGPGSSSFWLHMGILGPKRIVVNDPDFTRAAPYQLVNNEFSILKVADLVMIDPVGTGLSVAVGEAKYADFWGVDQDISSIANFIMQYLKENGRMNSPKYLLGESYGTFRNAGLMNYLLGRGFAMNGVIMVSAVFDLRSLVFPPSEDLPFIVHLPTYAATAWYHNKISKSEGDIESFVQRVREFTEDTYVPALYKGDKLTEVEQKKIAGQLEDITGVSESYWIKANLRVQAGEFFNELMRGEGKTVGRLDSRYTGINQNLLDQSATYDPQSAAISPAYISGFLHYFHNDLNVDPSHQYMTTAGQRKGFKWDWSHQGNSRWGTQAAITTTQDMAETLTRDPNMKVLILNGYYDIATVFYGVEHSIDHMGLEPDIKKNIIMKYYEAGHMMYTEKESLQQFKNDVEAFILETK